MSQSRAMIMNLLASAVRDGSPVTVRRKHLDWNTTHGFVIALTDSWVVMHALDGAYLEAVVLLRSDAITKVETHADAEYVVRAVTGLGTPVAQFDAAPDADVAVLLRSVVERADIVGVHLESHKGDWVNYGKVHRIGKKRADLQFIGRDGDWADYIDAWKLRKVTRIEFGGRYIRALEVFGDPIATAISRRRR